MQRRDFLTAVAATAAGGLNAQSAAAQPVETSPPGEDMDEYCARVDAGLARIGAWSPGAATGKEQLNDLARNALQAMYLGGMFGDLPVEKQIHAGMQERVQNAMPLFDQAVGGMEDYLASRTEADLATTHEILRHADVRKTLIDTLDEEAGKTGLSAPRRRQTRKMLEEITWRLANQPPQLIVNEYLEKVAKVGDSDIPSESRRRRVVARVGEEAFWQAAGKSTRDARISRGAKTMGVGVVIFGVSALIVSAGGFVAVFGATVGVIVMLIGLIMLIVGLLTPQDPTRKPAPAPAR